MYANPTMSPAEVLAYRGAKGAKKPPTRHFAEPVTSVVDGVAFVVLPLDTPNPLRGSHGHWWVAAKLRKRHRVTAHMMVSLAQPRPKLPVVITMARLSPGELDDDNLRAALKGVRDGVADAFGVNDRDKRVVWEYGQRRQREWGVEIRVEPAAENR